MSRQLKYDPRKSWNQEIILLRIKCKLLESYLKNHTEYDEHTQETLDDTVKKYAILGALVSELTDPLDADPLDDIMYEILEAGIVIIGDLTQITKEYFQARAKLKDNQIERVENILHELGLSFRNPVSGDDGTSCDDMYDSQHIRSLRTSDH